jgi:hypothetical protein
MLSAIRDIDADREAETTKRSAKGKGKGYCGLNEAMRRMGAVMPTKKKE